MLKVYADSLDLERVWNPYGDCIARQEAKVLWSKALSSRMRALAMVTRRRPVAGTDRLSGANIPASGDGPYDGRRNHKSVRPPDTGAASKHGYASGTGIRMAPKTIGIESLYPDSLSFRFLVDGEVVGDSRSCMIQ
jgi:hypothetical protein